jgi:hypothetical protein
METKICALFLYYKLGNQLSSIWLLVFFSGFCGGHAWEPASLLPEDNGEENWSFLINFKVFLWSV